MFLGLFHFLLWGEGGESRQWRLSSYLNASFPSPFVPFGFIIPPTDCCKKGCCCPGFLTKFLRFSFLSFFSFLQVGRSVFHGVYFLGFSFLPPFPFASAASIPHFPLAFFGLEIGIGILSVAFGAWVDARCIFRGDVLMLTVLSPPFPFSLFLPSRVSLFPPSGVYPYRGALFLGNEKFPMAFSSSLIFSPCPVLLLPPPRSFRPAPTCIFRGPSVVSASCATPAIPAAERSMMSALHSLNSTPPPSFPHSLTSAFCSLLVVIVLAVLKATFCVASVLSCAKLCSALINNLPNCNPVAFSMM